jgi:sulfide:quinone oxidoreductase
VALLHLEEQDRLATERWLDEGGHLGKGAVVEAKAARSRRPSRARARRRVLIVGGGVAGLETLLALRALAADRVDLAIASPEPRFVNRSMAVDQPFDRRRVRGLRLETIAAEFGAQWIHASVDRVEHERRVVVTTDRDEVPYDWLVLALGARPERAWHSEGVLTYHGGRDGPGYRLLLVRIHEGAVRRLAFVRPGGPSWPLLLYDLALKTAADCVSHGTRVELSLITPEEHPLGIFGPLASRLVRRLLDESGVTLHAGSYGAPGRAGTLEISPGRRRLAVDRIVTEPRLAGPRLRGVPCGADGFLRTDGHGRLAGLDDVFAAGDATAFPIKHGGLAAQQADAVAEAIACLAGADVDPQPFRPVLRSVLRSGGGTHYLRADISGRAGTDSTVSDEPLWWPPNRLCGRHLAPYLSSPTRRLSLIRRTAAPESCGSCS